MLKVKLFNCLSTSSLQDDINSFSENHDVVDIQYSSNIHNIIGLQQQCAECRVLHTVMVVYKEEK